MTIKEMCDKYNLNASFIHKKLKSHREELGEHVYEVKGVINVDDYAEEFLLPEKIKATRLLTERVNTLLEKIRNLEDENSNFIRENAAVYEKLEIEKKEKEELVKQIGVSDKKSEMRYQNICKELETIKKSVQEIKEILLDSKDKKKKGIF